MVVIILLIAVLHLVMSRPCQNINAVLINARPALPAIPVAAKIMPSAGWLAR